MNPVAPSAGRAEGRWTSALVLHEHHHESLATTEALSAVVIRAGRGTRQDGRWVEHVLHHRDAGASLGSYWHVYPSRTDPYHQAELWGAAISSVDASFSIGHWADLSSTDEFPEEDLLVYLHRFLRRADALLGHEVGVYARAGVLSSSARRPFVARPQWCAVGDIPVITTSGIEVRETTPEFPGLQRVRRPVGTPMETRATLQVAPRRPHESVSAWRSRWHSGAHIAELQEQLNELGADLVVDGTFGPQTDAALRTWEALCKRDGVPSTTTGIGHTAEEILSRRWLSAS